MRSSKRRRVMHHVLRAVGLAVATATVGCQLLLGTDDFEKAGTATATEQLCSASPLGRAVDKIDLLFVIDNSRGMDDKTSVLASSIGDLLAPLINPPCLDGTGAAASQPPGPLDDCPAGTQRATVPIADLHVGVISSSLGDYGGDGCATSGGQPSSPDNDQRARLLSRGPDGATIPTYQDLGFLRFDASGEDDAAISDVSTLVDRTADILRGVGDSGCGYEAPLEAWYRFLVDPNPYLDVVADGNLQAQLIGTDDVVLQQRQAFLRSDSLVLIAMLTDENDCSVKITEGGQGAVVLSSKFNMPRARAICANAPNDACCAPCIFDDIPGCTPKAQDSACQKGDRLTLSEDSINLRCFNQKQRFGIDFLYPIERYVNALTEPGIDTSHDDLAIDETTTAVTVNPLANRGPGRVVFAGIVGVPWQTIARRDPGGQPDLLNGVDSQGQQRGGFMSGGELDKNQVWPLLLGDPNTGAPPADPYMIESSEMRTGSHPITGDAMAPCTEGNVAASSINGCEFNTMGGDLQFACVHQLLEPELCNGELGCFCNETSSAPANPVCSDPMNPQLVTHSAARPGTRHLRVMEALGSQAIAASSCLIVDPLDPNLTATTAQTIVGAISDYLTAPLTSRCAGDFGQAPTDSTQPANCTLITSQPASLGPCDCTSSGRAELSPQGELVRTSVLDSAFVNSLLPPTDRPTKDDCFCELNRLEGGELSLCLNDDSVQPTVNGQAVSGWCYLRPGLGNPQLITGCGDLGQYRMLGGGQPTQAEYVWAGCFAEPANTCPDDGAE